jgi:hypothetical protein
MTFDTGRALGDDRGVIRLRGDDSAPEWARTCGASVRRGGQRETTTEIRSAVGPRLAPVPHPSELERDVERLRRRAASRGHRARRRLQALRVDYCVQCVVLYSQRGGAPGDPDRPGRRWRGALAGSEEMSAGAATPRAAISGRGLPR